MHAVPLRPGGSIRALAAFALLLLLGLALTGSGSDPVAPPARAQAPDPALRGAAQAIALLTRRPQAAAAPTPEPNDGVFRARVVAEARRQLRTGPPPGFRDDCSGLVSGVFTQAGAPMDGVVASIWDLAVEHNALHWELLPRPGELIFFDDTHDRNHNGRRDDILTHIGVVLNVDLDGTVTFAHGGTSRGRVEGRMNLLHPSERKSPAGKVWNEPLRLAGSAEPEDAARLTGELWVAWGRVDPSLDWKTWVRWVPLP